ncbi:MAG TPA: ATP-binding protein [Ktedonosporobacter sp.]|nr:ATP-binding protein [Ktedonosporobacter sp.]
MERLNHVIGKTGPRRPINSEQRPSQSTPSQGARPRIGGQGEPTIQPSAQPLSRRPAPEQTARPGQRNIYTTAQQNQYLSSAPPPSTGAQLPPGVRRPRATQEPGPPNNREGRAYGAPNTRQLYPRTRPVTQNSAPQEPRRPLPQENEIRYTRPPRSTDEYRHSDDYTTPLQSDVVEEWEEDTSGMRYGDWEDEENEVLIYQRADVKVVADALLDYAPPTRDIPDIADQHRHTRVTRDLRNSRLPIPSIAPSAVPSARTPDERPPHRMTQPLNKHALINANRERDGAQESQQLQRQIRQVVPREPVQLQPFPSPRPPQVIKNACPKCRGAGYLRANVPYGHPNFGKPIACECKEAERKEKRRQQLRSMSDLDAFQDKSFRTFNPRVPGVQDAFKEAWDYAEEPHGWLLLVGPNGCGKTHLAIAIANQCLEDGSVVLFSVVPDLLDHLRATFAPKSEELYDQLFSKMREAEVLVLDDMGAQQSSPWANEKLFQLLNYRYNMEMPTVITANLKGLQGIDERIYSRLHDVSLVSRINMDRARDYRPNHPRRG